MKVVSIEHLTKKFKDIIAVDDLSIAITEGEIYGLLGPNGAGKTTAINILCSLLTPTKGDIKIFGEDIKQKKSNIKSNIGIVPQDIAIYYDLTAYENVKFFGSLYGLKGSRLKECAEKALEFVDLLDKSKRYPSEFSGGMKRRLNIACAIVHSPKIIIMDEPTVGIDPQSRNHILNSVKLLNSMGSTIIYTSHYMEEVEEICTKIGIIDHGKLITEGTSEELKNLITDRNNMEITTSNITKVKREEIIAIPGVIDVEIVESTVKIASRHEVNNLDKIINYFTSNNISIKNIESKVPDLETVFLTLTGRKLRE